jgi:hypothetical protein
MGHEKCISDFGGETSCKKTMKVSVKSEMQMAEDDFRMDFRGTGGEDRRWNKLAQYSIPTTNSAV